MDIQAKIETTILIQLTETEARAAIRDPRALQHAIQRAFLPDADGHHAMPAARRKVPRAKHHAQRRSPRPKAKTMICSTCGKVYKRPNLFQRHIQKHIAAPVAAS